MKNIEKLFIAERNEVAAFMRRLYRQGLTTTSGGNISLRVDREQMLLTPSKLDKARLKGSQIGIVKLDGTNVTPNLTPSIEIDMHLEIYRRNETVAAVVHAHPPVATALTATQRDINTRYIAESYAILGNPVRAAYARMGTPELAQNVAGAAVQGNCVLLDNHGVLTVGGSLLEAFDRLEVLERAAETMLTVEQAGGGRELAQSQLDELDDMMGGAAAG